VSLGSAYERGKGVQADLVGALALYQQACDGGESVGCVSLAFLHERGQGVPADSCLASVSRAELAQVVIGVAIGPSLPVEVGHGPEKPVGGDQGARRRPRNLLEARHRPRAIAREL